jgi:WhiB family redox-sensing transcriptional regulator
MEARWLLSAACRSEDSELFFAPTSENAVATCLRCPVVTNCLAHSAVESVQDGIWAGLTASQRVLALARLQELGFSPSDLGGKITIGLLDSSGVRARSKPEWVVYRSLRAGDVLGYVRIAEPPLSVHELPPKLAGAQIAMAWLHIARLNPGCGVHYERAWQLLSDAGFQMPGEGRKGELRNVYAAAANLVKRGLLERREPGVFRALPLGADRTQAPWPEIGPEASVRQNPLLRTEDLIMAKDTARPRINRRIR